jgi:hypothetical protein
MSKITYDEYLKIVRQSDTTDEDFLVQFFYEQP